MLQIILCEDNHQLRKQFRSYIESYLDKHRLGRVVLSTDQPDQVLGFVQGALEKDPEIRFVYFFDIELNQDMDGMVLAKEVRKMDDHGEIIFITSFNEHIARNFEYRLKTMDYIDKSVDVQSRINKCLDDIRKHVLAEKKEKWLNIEAGTTSYRNRYGAVLAFEGTRDHKVVVVEDDKTYTITAKLSGVEATLEYPFMRIHRSFIINTMHLKRHFREGQALHVEMTNGRVYPVARKYGKEIINRE